jgi:anti-sigma regulatory factor (Ser/Thr protein kinase)
MRHVQDRLVTRERGDIRGVLLGELRLPIRPESASAARRFLKVAAIAWGIPDVADIAELLGCELVTNVVRYAEAMPGSTLRLLMVREGERLRIEVHDPSVNPPVLKTPTLDDTRGRGLVLVDTLSADAGWHPTAHGKAVWFEVIPDWPSVTEGYRQVPER